MDYHPTLNDDTICAISTAPGKGGIAVIRVSGKDAIDITDKVFKSSKGKKLKDAKSQTICYGQLVDEKETIDTVLISVFRKPHSFTGEDTTEISCHGSIYIQQRILQVLIKNGCRMAKPGEYTKRGFLNNKMDLSQAEAVADLIASTSAAAHRIAMSQMRGGFSKELNLLRDDLLKFVSLIELELDFSTEDVEFADRQELFELIQDIKQKISKLADSFSLGNAIKNGVPVAIIGKTNVGKSTLLNWLLNEDKAIVSDINGTTRDVIEDTMVYNGTTFRIIDTAGMRETEDTVEKLGIKKSYQKMSEAQIVLLMVDCSDSVDSARNFINEYLPKLQDKKALVLFNKEDLIDNDKRILLTQCVNENENIKSLFISAQKDINKEGLLNTLYEYSRIDECDEDGVIVSNVRHYEALKKAESAICRVEEGLELELSGDLLSQDIHDCIDALGEITGKISSDEVLGNIFSHFCIGK